MTSVPRAVQPLATRHPIPEIDGRVKLHETIYVRRTPADHSHPFHRTPRYASPEMLAVLFRRQTHRYVADDLRLLDTSVTSMVKHCFAPFDGPTVALGVSRKQTTLTDPTNVYYWVCRRAMLAENSDIQGGYRAFERLVGLYYAYYDVPPEGRIGDPPSFGRGDTERFRTVFRRVAMAAIQAYWHAQNEYTDAVGIGRDVHKQVERALDGYGVARTASPQTGVLSARLLCFANNIRIDYACWTIVRTELAVATDEAALRVSDELDFNVGGTIDALAVHTGHLERFASGVGQIDVLLIDWKTTAKDLSAEPKRSLGKGVFSTYANTRLSCFGCQLSFYKFMLERMAPRLKVQHMLVVQPGVNGRVGTEAVVSHVPDMTELLDEVMVVQRDKAANARAEQEAEGKKVETARVRSLRSGARKRRKHRHTQS